MTQNLQLPDVPRGTVVVGVDGSPGSDSAVDWAADAAAREHRTLVAVHTQAPMAAWSVTGYPTALAAEGPEMRAALLAAGRICTAAARERAHARHENLEVLEISDVIDPRVGLAAASGRAHLLVVGSRGRGRLTSLLLGSVSVSLTRGADCPVVVVRPGEGTGSRVLALVDGSSTSTEVIDFAARHASETRRPLDITHLLWTAFTLDARLVADSQRMLAEISAGLTETYPDVEVTLDVESAADPEHLVASTRDVSLVVVGHHRGGRMHQLIYRSVSTAVLEHADVPVAIVPTTGD